MKINIKAGDVMNEQEWQDLVTMVTSRAIRAEKFMIDLENSKEIDLAQFNALVMLYVSLRRQRKKVQYFNCQEASIQKFISKTQFDHVFVK